ncbi:cyclic nucleotide gated cation channel alpha 3 [Echinococcus multilocularis]|uniref:Cyclic nucleotide gated cation channel alpha 3 n=1 Tax=Echinococcus multilocularis TaxID=6211 RepID=A0A068YGT3_ECHMU|nr:cyclic nucleotide gated cation channel alpha 3 [Echinococcus multilocularis]
MSNSVETSGSEDRKIAKKYCCLCGDRKPAKRHRESNTLIVSLEEAHDPTDDHADVDEDQEPQRPLYKKIKLWAQTSTMDTSSQLYYRWLGLVSLTVLYNCIILPMRTAFTQFHELSPPVWMFIDYCIDFIYLLDIWVGCRTGYLEEGLVVTDVVKLRNAYIKKSDCLMDVFAVLPTDLLYISQAFTHYAAWLRLNRLLKAYKVFEFIARTETRASFPNVFRVITLTAGILILIHINACVFFEVSTQTGLCENSFVYPPRSTDDITDEPCNLTERWQSIFSQYTYSFYWSTLILTTIGETPKPVRDGEYIFITIDFLAGVLIFATVVGNVGAMIANMNAQKTEFQAQMDSVKRYMEYRKVSKGLERRVIQWFDYLWSNKQSLEEENVLAILPDKLKAEIAIHVHYDTLQRVKIFQDCDPGLLVELVLKLKLQIFSPGDYICRKGDIGKEMYIVKRGKISVVADDGKTTFVTLGEGTVFGEISILNIAGNKTGNRRTANVRSVGYSDLFCLSKDDLWEALTEYPEAKEKLMEAGQQMLRKDNLLDEELLRKAEENRETIEERVNRIDATLGQIGTKLARLLGEYGSSQAKIKRRITRLENQQFNSLPTKRNSRSQVFDYWKKLKIR